MSALDPKITSLITEHFNYTPLEVVDDIINAANESVYGTVQQLENYLRASGPSALGFVPPGSIADTDEDGKEIWDDAAMNEVYQGLHMLEMLMEAKVDKAWDIFEIYVLRNIFAVPPDVRDWMRLRHHDGVNLVKQSSLDPETTVTPESLSLLRQQLQETTALHRFLKADVARNDKIIKSLNNLLDPSPDQRNPLSFILSPDGQAHSTKNISEDTAFATIQVKELRKLVNELKEKSDSVFGENDDSAIVDQGVSEKEKTRAMYVEKMSRRHLEKARGLNLNNEGGLKSGGDLLGIRKSEADVDALGEVLSKIPDS